MTRRTLPDRRPSITHRMMHGGIEFHVSVGYAENGHVGEVFIGSDKRSGEVDVMARDFGLVLSLLLQHGCTVDVISAAVGKGSFLAKVIETVEWEEFGET